MQMPIPSLIRLDGIGHFLTTGTQTVQHLALAKAVFTPPGCGDARRYNNPFNTATPLANPLLIKKLINLPVGGLAMLYLK